MQFTHHLLIFSLLFTVLSLPHDLLPFPTPFTEGSHSIDYLKQSKNYLFSWNLKYIIFKVVFFLCVLGSIFFPLNYNIFKTDSILTSSPPAILKSGDSYRYSVMPLGDLLMQRSSTGGKFSPEGHLAASEDTSFDRGDMEEWVCYSRLLSKGPECG